MPWRDLLKGLAVAAGLALGAHLDDAIAGPSAISCAPRFTQFAGPGGALGPRASSQRTFVGQGVGLMNEQQSTKQVIYDFMQDFLAAAERLGTMMAE